MLYFYEGSPGSGKSLHVSRQIDEALRCTSQNVICNFDCDLRVIASAAKKKTLEDIQSRFCYKEDSKLSPEFLYSFCMEHHKFEKKSINGVEQLHCPEHQTLIVIDEAEIVFNCRCWNDKKRASWLQFFNLHRHFGYDIIMIAPSIKSIDKQIPPLVEIRTMHMNFKNWNLMGRVVAFLMGGSLFVAHSYWRDVKSCTKSEIFRYNKRLGSIYNTSAIFMDGRMASALGGGHPAVREVAPQQEGETA